MKSINLPEIYHFERLKFCVSQMLMLSYGKFLSQHKILRVIPLFKNYDLSLLLSD